MSDQPVFGRLMLLEPGARAASRNVRGAFERGSFLAVFGLMGLLLVFVVGQSIWLGRHMQPVETETSDENRAP
jgi:hypothetical protein